MFRPKTGISLSWEIFQNKFPFFFFWRSLMLGWLWKMAKSLSEWPQEPFSCRFVTFRKVEEWRRQPDVHGLPKRFKVLRAESTAVLFLFWFFENTLGSGSRHNAGLLTCCDCQNIGVAIYFGAGVLFNSPSFQPQGKELIRIVKGWKGGWSQTAASIFGRNLKSFRSHNWQVVE